MKMNMNMKSFLEELDTKGGVLFEGEGKEGDKIDAGMKAALQSAKIAYQWVYQPEGYDLVVVEHDKDGEKKDSWSVIFFTEAEMAGKEPEEKIFDEKMYEAAAGKVGMKIVDQSKGNFLDAVQLCIELASNKAYKGGFTSAKVKQAETKAKAKK